MSIIPFCLINKKLWDAANWRDTAFLVTGDFESQLGIGLLFEDYEVGKKIFEEWHAQLGKADVRDLLRVSIRTASPRTTSMIEKPACQA